ncbi:hypothetical protein [Niallia sp. NCCP-28]|uniref:hypothetical protein n=1 Tax=Niallia sp. NCCP-28 TaxID=2934712 RepID=UPI00207DF6C6|nr:hypothetical protein [Niallia sp. NCCP-28]GKU83934.1 hypothetical protein NCCP28_33300 [Niallia sp. NCCP-28]
MEHIQKKSILLVGITLTGIVLLLYIFSLKSQLQEVRSNQSRYEEKIKNLKMVQDSEAKMLNKTFLEKFFTYENTADRYKGIESFMTEQGLSSTHPSGTEIPSTKESVASSIRGLKAYEHQISTTETSFINEFQFTTTYNGVADMVTTIIKTELLYVDHKGWKVNDVEYIGELTGSR